MPEKVATAFGKVVNQLVGASYSPIAYLGSQLVHGTNHAILAEQTLIDGRETKNVVLIILNEFSDKFTIVNIERVFSSGGELGGTEVNVKTEIPEDATKVLKDAMGGFVGASIKPFAFLGTQVVKGINYIFAAEAETVTKDSAPKIAIVRANSELKIIASISDIL
jgi:hypothetical protein